MCWTVHFVRNESRQSTCKCTLRLRCSHSIAFPDLLSSCAPLYTFINSVTCEVGRHRLLEPNVWPKYFENRLKATFQRRGWSQFGWISYTIDPTPELMNAFLLHVFLSVPSSWAWHKTMARQDRVVSAKLWITNKILTFFIERGESDFWTWTKWLFSEHVICSKSILACIVWWFPALCCCFPARARVKVLAWVLVTWCTSRSNSTSKDTSATLEQVRVDFIVCPMARFRIFGLRLQFATIWTCLLLKWRVRKFEL